MKILLQCSFGIGLGFGVLYLGSCRKLIQNGILFEIRISASDACFLVSGEFHGRGNGGSMD